MKKLIIAIVFNYIICLSSTWSAETWHFPLYLDGGKPAIFRYKINVMNSSEQDSEGMILSIPANTLNFGEIQKRRIRIVGENGKELLFSTTPNSDIIEDDSIFGIPVYCKAGSKTKFWIYVCTDGAIDVPDKLIDKRNVSFSDSFELGDNSLPSNWIPRTIDDQHKNIWANTVARTGTRSLHTSIKMDSKPSWVSFIRQIPVIPGSKFRLTGFVKGDGLVGDKCAGFYVSFKNKKSEMENNKPLIYKSDLVGGDFDWTKQEIAATVPDDYCTMTIGTVAYAQSGDAYFDDITLAFDDLPNPKGISYQINEKESLGLEQLTCAKAWEADEMLFPLRLLISFYNLGDKNKNCLAVIPVNRLTAGNFEDTDYAIYNKGQIIPFMRAGENLIFELNELPPCSERQYSLYVRGNPKNKSVSNAHTVIASEILSDHKYEAKMDIDKILYAKWMLSDFNMLINPDFESDTGWLYASESKNQLLNEVLANPFADDGLFGKHSAKLELDNYVIGWTGYRQKVKLHDRTSYLIMGYGKRLNGANTKLTLHYYSESLSNLRQYPSCLIAYGDNEWNSAAITINNEYHDGVIEVHLTNKHACNAEFDGMLMAECINAGSVTYEYFKDLSKDKYTDVWQVNSAKKIFPFSIPIGSEKSPAISLAKNESENLQLALRSNQNIENLKITVSEPTLNGNFSLCRPEVLSVKYVIIDGKSDYFKFNNYKPYERCVPPLSRMEYYPDPLVPFETLELSPGQTEAVYISFKANIDAVSGEYCGVIKVYDGEVLLKDIPYRVTVRDFSIPSNSSLTAIFDKRGSRYNADDSIKEYNIGRMEMQDFLVTKRASVDRPVDFVYENGKIDFSDFDKSCRCLFDIDNVPLQYIPGVGRFNFGHPLPCLEGIHPYPGKYPYVGADRSIFNSDYKALFQKRLETIWGHIKINNWQTHFMYYIADEPAFRAPEVIKQLSAFCDMVHGVDPEIKTYSSTWEYIPAWKGKIDIWGIGVQSIEDIQKIKNDGAEFIFTTDGRFCIDTPYNSLERMMPVYCYVYGALGFEYWGIDAYTRDPFQWGIHKDRISNIKPGSHSRNRFPNGDGYFAYPGFLSKKSSGVLSSIRMEAIRDGVEDYEYYKTLEALANKCGDKDSLMLLKNLKSIVPIPNPGGRQSVELLPDPELLTLKYRNAIAEHIENLVRKQGKQ